MKWSLQKTVSNGIWIEFQLPTQPYKISRIFPVRRKPFPRGSLQEISIEPTAVKIGRGQVTNRLHKHKAPKPALTRRVNRTGGLVLVQFFVLT